VGELRGLSPGLVNPGFYLNEALSDAAFLHTLVLPGRETGLPQPVHSMEPAHGRADLDLPGASHAS
jgi:hypothetical protein